MIFLILNGKTTISPFVILQIWPKIQIAKIVKLGVFDKRSQWRSMKNSMEREVSSVGEITRFSLIDLRSKCSVVVVNFFLLF